MKNQTKPTSEAKHTPGKWHVLPDPVWKDKHPFHQARFIATSVDVEIDGESWTFANPDDVIICTMPDSENQKSNAALIASAPDLLKQRDGLQAKLEFERNHPAGLASLLKFTETQRDDLLQFAKFAIAMLTQPVQFSQTTSEGTCGILRNDAAAVVTNARAAIASVESEGV